MMLLAGDSASLPRPQCPPGLLLPMMIYHRRLTALRLVAGQQARAPISAARPPLAKVTAA
jgi:hypothetical protein